MSSGSNGLKFLRSIIGKEVSEGAGVKVTRTIGGSTVSVHDPFLLLDEAKLPGGGTSGFPEHPHRGFETVSYILKGESKHRDSIGNSGFSSAGDAHWMTAGRGIRHEETPIGNGPMHGFQIWVNLKAKDKMIDPYYQYLKAELVPKKQISEHVHLSVIAGKSISHQLQSPIKLKTPVLISHGKISKKNEKFTETIPVGFQGLIYFFEGSAKVSSSSSGTGGDERIGEEKSAILFGEVLTEDSGGAGGANVELESLSENVQFLMLAGEPTGEPVARHGPFVMNTKEEIMQAFEDYHSGKF